MERELEASQNRMRQEMADLEKNLQPRVRSYPGTNRISEYCSVTLWGDSYFFCGPAYCCLSVQSKHMRCVLQEAITDVDYLARLRSLLLKETPRSPTHAGTLLSGNRILGTVIATLMGHVGLVSHFLNRCTISLAPLRNFHMD